jgi:anti-anti-sigma factor
MEITISEKKSRVPVTVFRVKGEIAASNYQQLEQRAREAYEAGTRYLLLDLDRVTFLSSAGVRAISVIYNLLRSESASESDEAVQDGILDGTYKSSHLKLLKPGKQVLKTIEMAGLDMYLEVFTSEKKAMASF